ncbi:hypothetical protein FB451DRAFT_1366209 [Mycena latifolia]|nr:hypothetical protein FB451DRAFT_1366209 [Mycena latifolia]
MYLAASIIWDSALLESSRSDSLHCTCPILNAFRRFPLSILASGGNGALICVVQLSRERIPSIYSPLWFHPPLARRLRTPSVPAPILSNNFARVLVRFAQAQPTSLETPLPGPPPLRMALGLRLCADVPCQAVASKTLHPYTAEALGNEWAHPEARRCKFGCSARTQELVEAELKHGNKKDAPVYIKSDSLQLSFFLLTAMDTARKDTSNMDSSTTSSAPHPADRDELAGAALWTVYISEAEKYDKALVDGWKSDMEGLLIFAGLFSASLTAFLIESYRTLTPDQGAITIALLVQISRQLDPSSNGKSADAIAAASASFTPSPASLACNTLWFLSLGLSLACALIATLVEQWSRDFIQRTEMRPSPIVRARIFSYLYFGMERFGMHAVVEFIPLLLHVSLLLFFAGLVAFLLPINLVVMVVAAVLLGFIAATYMYLTVLPIISSDSPYRTPLSNVAWGVFRRFSGLMCWHRVHLPDEESTIALGKSAGAEKSIPTMIEVMNRDAVADSASRDERDGRAIVWTVKSLTDNNELESFADALPALIWGPTGRRRGYDRMINMLLDDPDIHLVPRIEGLLRSCDNGLLTPELESHRRIACIKALWSIAYFVASNASAPNIFSVFDAASLLAQKTHPHPQIRTISLSAYALIAWIRFCSLSSDVEHAFSRLQSIPPVQDPRGLLQPLHREAAAQLAEVQGYAEFCHLLTELMSLDFADTYLLVEKSRDAVNSLETTAYYILMDYLRFSAAVDIIPYEFEATCEIMQPSRASPIPAVYTQMKETLKNIVESNESKIYNLDSEVHHIDIIIDLVLQFLQTGQEWFDIDLAEALALYVGVRTKPSAGFNRALGRCSPKRLCSMLTNYLVGGSGRDTQLTVYTIWSLCLWAPQLTAFNKETLTAVCAAPKFEISASAIAALKSTILAAATDLSPGELDALMDGLHMPFNAFGTPPPGDQEEHLKRGAWMIFIEYLEQIDPSVLPGTISRCIDTFKFLSDHCPQRAPLFLQRRFASWLLGITDDPSTQPEPILDAVMNWLWAARRTGLQQFDDAIAKKTISEALKKYAATARPTENPEDRLQTLRLQAQVLGVDLNAPPTIDVDGDNGIDVSLDHKRKTPDSDASSQSSSYHTPTVSEGHCPPAHQSGRDDMQTTTVTDCGSPGFSAALAAPT